MNKHRIAILFLAVLGCTGCDDSNDLYLNGNPQKKIPMDTGCTNACSGDAECVDNTSYRLCQTDDLGCWQWSKIWKCDEGQACKDGECIPDPTDCTNTCEGDAECAGESSYRLCKADESGCKHWTEPTPCDTGMVCQKGTCITPAAECTDPCEGDAECVGENSYRTCKADESGCKHWTEPTPCDDASECKDGRCIPKTPTCTNACPSNGSVQCNGKNVETCDDYNADGCLEWGNAKECPYGCDAGACRKFPECTTSVCPKPVTEFNQWIPGNTSGSQNVFNAYPSCHDVGVKDTQNESGPEDYYMISLDEPGVLVVSLKQGKNVDVDVHILDSLSADQCLARGDISTASYLNAGIHYVSVDTFGNAGNAGSYEIIFYFLPDSGKCGMVQKVMNRYNDDVPLQMPVAGKVGRESHLVTTHDQQVHGGSSWWPSDDWDADSLKIHKEYTQSLFGSVISYGTSEGDNKWCSENSKGQAGHPSCGHALPPKAEAWDVNMYWNPRPPEGTFYLVFNPANGKAVIAAAGYETGPGEKTQMGGAVPEIHNYFGTSHKSVMLFGELKNQNLTEDDYGPIDCFQ